MTTTETANRTKTAYFIKYVSPIDAYGIQRFYYQLVRTRDCAILYANENLNTVYIECWKRNILYSEVTIW